LIADLACNQAPGQAERGERMPGSGELAVAKEDVALIQTRS